MNRLLTLLILLISFRSGAQEKYFLLEGTIGSSRVIMELQQYREGEWSGNYFYLNQKKNIGIEGREEARSKILLNHSPLPGNEGTEERLELVQKGSGFTGSWSGKNKKLPVVLSRLDLNKFSHPHPSPAFIRQLKTDRPYEYVKTGGMQFTRVKQTVEGNCTLDWYREKSSGIVMPRILKGYSAAALKKINDALLGFHLSESLEKLYCTSVPRSDYEFNNNKIFAGRSVLSLSFVASYYCGGAHPDFSYINLNFDALTGRRLELDDVVWFGNTRPPSPDHELRAYYRDSVFRMKVVELLSQLYPEEMSGQVDDGCPYNEPSSWTPDSWFFTKQGLYLGAVFPRYARACDSPDWSVLPYTVLQPYLSPEFKTRLLKE